MAAPAALIGFGASEAKEDEEEREEERKKKERESDLERERARSREERAVQGQLRGRGGSLLTQFRQTGSASVGRRSILGAAA